MAVTLTPEQIASFHELGFLPLPGLVKDEAFLAPLERACEAAYARVCAVASAPEHAATIAAAIVRKDAHIVVFSGGPGSDTSRYTYQLRKGVDAAEAATRTSFGMDVLSVRHVAWCGKDDPVLTDLGRDDRIMSVAAQLLGLGEDPAVPLRVTQMINQTHFKEPKDGVAFAWHQDSMHRRMAFGDFVDVNGKGSYVQVIVAVEDNTIEAGPLQFIPRSGKEGHIGGKAGLDPSTVDATTAVTPLLKRGDAVCLNPYVIHGSQPNESAGWRRTFINGFAYPGAQLARNVVYCEEVDVRPELIPAAAAAPTPAAGEASA